MQGSEPAGPWGLVVSIESEKGDQYGPNGISVVGWMLHIWMADGNAVGVYKSATKKECQWVLARDGYRHVTAEARKRDARGGVC